MTGDPEEMQRRIDAWAQSFADKAERYRSVQEKTEEIRLTASNPNGAVRVTVRADGSVDDLQFTEKTRTMSLSELSAQVLTTMRRAQGDIAERVSQVMTETLGDEDSQTRSMTIGHLQERFPKQEEDEVREPDPDPGAGQEPEEEPAKPAASSQSAPSAPNPAATPPPARPSPSASPKRSAADDDPDEDNEDFDLLAD